MANYYPNRIVALFNRGDPKPYRIELLTEFDRFYSVRRTKTGVRHFNVPYNHMGYKVVFGSVLTYCEPLTNDEVAHIASCMVAERKVAHTSKTRMPFEARKSRLSKMTV